MDRKGAHMARWRFDVLARDAGSYRIAARCRRPELGSKGARSSRPCSAGDRRNFFLRERRIEELAQAAALEPTRQAGSAERETGVCEKGRISCGLCAAASLRPKPTQRRASRCRRTRPAGPSVSHRRSSNRMPHWDQSFLWKAGGGR